jgi:integrase
MTFEQQSRTYMREIQTRRRNPVRTGTAKVYQSYLDSRILPLLGRKDLADVENGTAKAFLVDLNSSDLAPATISAIFKVIKAVVASAVDLNGNELYPRTWNHDFIDLPIVDKAGQDTPTLTHQKVTEAVLRATGQYQAMFTLLAASGLRVGEALALRDSPGDGRNSYWDAQTGILHVKTTLVDGKVQPEPKTPASIRQVDLAPEVNAYLGQAGLPQGGFLFRNSHGGPVRSATAYHHLEKAGVMEGFHAFRRFRITYLEGQNVPRGLAMYWTGHAEKDVHGAYIKIGQDLQTRKEWAVKAGIGFQLPLGE